MFRFVVTGCVVTTLFVPDLSLAQSAPAWSRTLPAPITQMQPSMSGLSLIQTKAGLLAVEPTTGREVWTRADGKEFALIGPALAVVTTASGQRVIDVETGKDGWTFGALGLRSVVDYIALPARDLVLVYGEGAAGGHAIVAVNAADGRIQWTQASLYKEPNLAKKAPSITYRTLLVDSESTVVLDPDDDGLVRLDLETGAVRWRIAESVLPSKRKPVALETSGPLILVRYDKSLYAVKADSGAIAWSQADDFPSPVAQTALTEAGLIVRGSHTVNGKGHISWKPYLTLLDPASGATRWTTEGTKFKGRSPFLLEGDTVTIALEEGIATYDVQTGQQRHVAGMREFQGGEHPTAIERDAAGGLLLRSSQNFRRFDASLAPAGEVYLKAPGMSFMAKFAIVALAVAASSASMAMAAPGQFYTVFTPNSDFLTAKYKGTTALDRFAYVFTEEPGSHHDRFALVRLDRSTIQESGRLKFTDRSPSFFVEPTTGVVLLGDGATLRGYQYAQGQ